MLSLRVFLSSPGDVAEEREYARVVLRALENEPQFRERLHLQEVSWDNPDAMVPLDAHLTPQEALDRTIPMPSECEVVIVILWSRLGTPLPAHVTRADGSRFLSGTEWEYEDAVAEAVRSGTPHVLVYRRQEVPAIALDDPDGRSKLKQFGLVQAFFERFTAVDGSMSGSYSVYAGALEFRQLLRDHLRQLFWQLLADDASEPPRSGPEELAPATWTGNPFKGLAAFDEGDAEIFFGRHVESDQLLRRVANQRFVAVVGPSGSGKSSLVAAGILPRLRAGALPGSGRWPVVRFTPGQASDAVFARDAQSSTSDPFRSLAAALVALAPALGPERKLALGLRSGEATLGRAVEFLLRDHPGESELVVFVDQFEELITLTDHSDREAFGALLERAVSTGRVRILITLRSDFYDQCLDYEPLVRLLRGGSFALGPPGAGALMAMIEGPARAARVRVEPELVERLLTVSGAQAGALPLLEYTLEQLYEARLEDVLTLASYDAIGGLAGAIDAQGERALSDHDVTEEDLDALFGALVVLGPDDAPARAASAAPRSP